MYCSNCGKQLNDDVNFCPSCGNPTQKNRKKPTLVNYSNDSDSGSVSSSDTDTGIWIFLGIACALIALLFLPPLFGGLGVFFGYKAKEDGNGAGGVAIMFISGACMLMGMFMGSIMYL